MKLLQRYLEMAQKARKMTTFQSFFWKKKLQLETELLDKYSVYYCIENYSFFPTDPTIHTIKSISYSYFFPEKVILL